MNKWESMQKSNTRNDELTSALGMFVGVSCTLGLLVGIVMGALFGATVGLMAIPATGAVAVAWVATHR